MAEKRKVKWYDIVNPFAHKAAADAEKKKKEEAAKKKRRRSKPIDYAARVKERPPMSAGETRAAAQKKMGTKVTQPKKTETKATKQTAPKKTVVTQPKKKKKKGY